MCGSFAADDDRPEQQPVNGKCPVCGSPISSTFELEEEHEHYEGSEDVPGILEVWLPFCGRGAECNRVTAANKMDELARPFLEACGNG